MSHPLARLATGVTALALLATLLVGLPIALVMMVGWPLPTQVPTWEQLERVLTTGEFDSWALVKALAVVVWVAWSQLTVSAVAEIVALSQGRRASRTPSVRPLRFAAAQLVTTAALLFGSIGRVADDAPIGPPDLQVVFADTAPMALPPLADPPADNRRDTIPIHLDGVGSEDVDEQAQLPVEAEEPVWHVRPRDTLWGIAESTLGDGMRWREIHELNVGQPQPDGRFLRPGDDLIRPGWVLHLPADASVTDMVESQPTPQPSEVEERPSTSITVERGDTLWGLAGTHLGDPHRWPELFETNRGHTQPDGRQLTDPDLIHPRWSLKVPAPTGAQPPGAPTREPDCEASGAAAEPPSEPGDPIPWAQLDSDTGQTPAPAPRLEPDDPDADRIVRNRALYNGSGAESTATDSDFDEGAQEDGDAVAERSLLLAGIGLAAAGVIATLDRLRRARQRRRAPGERIQLPGGERAAVERRVRGLADAATADLLDIALRSLAAACAQEGRHVPEVALVSMSADDVAVHLATTDADPPPGWQSDDDGMTWVLTRPADTQPLRKLAATALSPAPLLVTIGTNATTCRRVLLNLAHAHSLAIDADPETARTILLGHALELATTTRADALQIVLVDTDERLTALERIRYMSPTEAIELLEQHAAHLDPGELGDPATVALFLTAPPAESLDILTGLADTTLGDMALVSPQLPGTPWRLTTDGQTIRMAPHGLELEPLELTSADLAAIEELLVDAVTPSHAGSEQPKPEPQLDILTSTNGDAPATPHAPATADIDDSAVEVRILGPVEIEGAGDFASAKAEELVVYLALHRHGADADTLQEALWPGAVPSTGRLHTTVYRARQALGDDGQHLIPRAKQGRYRISPEIGLDYKRFNAHIYRADAEPEHAIGELRAALELVRGRPLSCTSGEYAWASYDVHAIEQGISDAAHRLAQLSLEGSQSEEARWAAEVGLAADPYCEILYRDLMLAAAESGNITEVHAIMQRLRRLLADESDANDTDDYLNSSTVGLFDDLTRQGLDRFRTVDSIVAKQEESAASARIERPRND